MITRLFFFSLPILIAGCGGPQGEPPSLGPRPIEGILDEPVRGIAPVASADNSALAAEIASLVERATRGQRDFTAAYPATQQAVGRASGAAVGSEPWIEAQLALSALDSTRSETIRALGDLDAILAEQALAAEPAETDALLAARDEVARLYEAQNARYDTLNARVRTR
ncbi:MAG: hypothetical protein AAGE05_04650 [Pseudomonadota bacterium]